jgi:hypothetical protein
MRGILRLAVLAAIGAATGFAAPAQAASGGVWDHNGSRIDLEENGAKRKLVYSEPREGLDKAGIKPGTELFNGELKADGRFAGFAKIFKTNCNPIDYFVEGSFDRRKGEIILQGQAPVYSGQGCEVSGYSDTTPASRLVFTRIGEAPETAVVAETPPQPVETQPQGQTVEQGDNNADDDEYLPPSQRGNRTARTEPEADPAPRRAQPDATPAPRRSEPDAPPALRRAEPETKPAPRREQREAERTTPRRDEPETRTPPRRERNPYAQRRQNPADIDESEPQPRYSRPPERRRYGRAFEPYEPRPYRRRPGIWDPEEDLLDDDDEDYYEDRPAPRYWRRGPIW